MRVRKRKRRSRRLKAAGVQKQGPGTRFPQKSEFPDRQGAVSLRPGHDFGRISVRSGHSDAIERSTIRGSIAMWEMRRGRHPGPLPRRESMRLLHCVRVMGEKKASYCRQKVLGESPLISTVLPASPPKPPPICSPRALSRKDFLTKPGTSKNDFGLTSLDLTKVTMPQVQVTRVPGGVHVKPTQAALPTIPSIFTGKGAFMEGSRRLVPQGSGGCRAGDYPVRWAIDAGGAEKIREGEQEHCDDFRYAFQISLRKYADAVNQLAASKRRFPNQAAVDRALKRMVGASPSQWAQVFECLAKKTLIRDRRRWHKPVVQRIPPRQGTNCKFAQAIVRSSSLPSVGKYPSSLIVKGCLKGPTKRKARGK